MDKFEQDLIDVMDIFISADEDVNTFYHYTTIDALVNGIMRDNAQKGKEVCFRATHSRFVNDSEEIIKGVGIIASVLERNDSSKAFDEYYTDFLRIYDDLFLISFSEKRDSLPMWNTYANRSTGITIGIERLKSMSKDDVVVKCTYGLKNFTSLLKIYTDPTDSKVAKIGSRLLLHFLPQMIKNEDFAYENEIRLIGKFNDSPIKFREKNGYIIPYKEVFFAKEQIKSITLGPCQNMKDAEYSLRQFLDSRGFEHVKIEKSKIPYRNL